jgi:glucose/mannose-6-phosphate isomerase
MADLDRFDPARADPGHMLDRIRELPQQVRDAWRAAGALQLPETYRAAHNALILGMGGSAIGGDLLRVYVAQECPIPIAVSREYELPAWVGSDTLVIGVSFSGGTEETLATFEQAARRGAKLLALSTGGRLAQMARGAGSPFLQVHYQSQPRAALGHLFTPLVRIFSTLGYIADKTAEYEEAVQVLDRLRDDYGPDRPAASNEAKQLAQALHGKIPVIYGAGLLSEVAHRWKTQVNENSKTFAYYEVYSELNHNAVVGYEHPEVARRDIAIVELDAPLVHPRLRARMDVTDRIMQRAGVTYHRVQAQGEGALAQMYAAITLGDYVTYYLALLNDADPTPVQTIDYLKGELAKVSTQ